MFLFFFFKQKTAYEMRISDWSSDVCSSDLHAEHHLVGHRRGVVVLVGDADHRVVMLAGERRLVVLVGFQPEIRPEDSRGRLEAGVGGRSEEHTSELQSLMRISYAVFCLKKKKQIKTI